MGGTEALKFKPCRGVTVGKRRVARKNCFLLASIRRSECMHEADLRQSVYIRKWNAFEIKCNQHYQLHRICNNITFSTHFQSTQDVDDDSAIEHWLRVDCCNGSLNFLESEALWKINLVCLHQIYLSGILISNLTWSFSRILAAPWICWPSKVMNDNSF